jgi:hypothetical protein
MKNTAFLCRHEHVCGYICEIAEGLCAKVDDGELHLDTYFAICIKYYLVTIAIKI